MFRFSIGQLIPVLGMCLGSCPWLLADEKMKSPAIEVGRPISETTAILRERKIESNPGGWQETAGNPDTAEVDFDLHEEMVARIFYSKSRKVVTHIGIVICPHGQGRGARSYFSASRIKLEDDGNYSVQFIPEAKAEKSAPKLKPEFPKSEVPPGKSPLQTGSLRPVTKPR